MINLAYGSLNYREGECVLCRSGRGGVGGCRAVAEAKDSKTTSNRECIGKANVATAFGNDWRVATAMFTDNCELSTLANNCE
jgi:hypothetical protein